MVSLSLVIVKSAVVNLGLQISFKRPLLIVSDRYTEGMLDQVVVLWLNLFEASP